MSKVQVQRFGRQLGWFAGIWTASLASLFVVATLIRLATAS